MSQNDLNSSPFQQPEPTIGTPERDAEAFPGQQSYVDTCAIRCQEFILEQYTGVDWNEDDLIQEATSNGWYIPGGGTMPENTGSLLEAHGIPVTRYENANVFNLTSELAQGHKVIVGVDSGELLGTKNSILESILEALGLQGADHALVVSGIDTSNPDDIRVIVSDPGTGEAAASYPLGEFVDAWKDSNFIMVATQQPAPQWLPEMANFNYELGHIPQVGNVPFNEFLAMEQTSDWINEVFPAQDPVLAEPQQFIDSMPQHTSPDSASAIPLDTAGLNANLQFADQLNAQMARTIDVVDRIGKGEISEEELAAYDAQMNAQIAMHQGMAISNSISNSVTQSHQTMLDQKYSHEQRIAADGYVSDARNHASKGEYDKARADLDRAAHHSEQADNYDPD